MATLVDNAATQRLLEILPLTVRLSPYGGFEVVGALPEYLPTSNSQITTKPGDIMLYQGNQLVVFYGNNSWSYTPIGHIDNATAASVKEFLGDGDVIVTLSADASSAAVVSKNTDCASESYDLNGRKVNLKKASEGIYIVDGKKRIIR